MGKLGIQTARERVKDYCADQKITQPAFAEMLHLSKSTLQRFMGAGLETTGKGSMAYAAINTFFQALDRRARKNAAGGGAGVKKVEKQAAPASQAPAAPAPATAAVVAAVVVEAEIQKDGTEPPKTKKRRMDSS